MSIHFIKEKHKIFSKLILSKSISLTGSDVKYLSIAKEEESIAFKRAFLCRKRANEIC